MPAYPSSIKAFTAKRDSDVALLNLAAHVNDLQDEVSAIQSTIGVNPQGLYPSLLERLTPGVKAADFETSGSVTAATVVMSGMYRLTVRWARSTLSSAPPSALRGYRLTVNGSEIGGRYIPDDTARTVTLADGTLESTLGDISQINHLTVGDVVTVTGIAVVAGSVYAPSVSARRLPS